MNTYIKGIIATLGGVVGAWCGGWDMGFKILVSLVLLDYLTGVLSAIYQRQLSSSIGFKGIIKKVAIFIVLVMGVRLDILLESGDMLRMGIIFFYSANEGISILENLKKMEVTLPSFLMKILEVLKQKADDTK